MAILCRHHSLRIDQMSIRLVPIKSLACSPVSSFRPVMREKEMLETILCNHHFIPTGCYQLLQTTAVLLLPYYEDSMEFRPMQSILRSIDAKIQYRSSKSDLLLLDNLLQTFCIRRSRCADCLLQRLRFPRIDSPLQTSVLFFDLFDCLTCKLNGEEMVCLIIVCDRTEDAY